MTADIVLRITDHNIQMAAWCVSHLAIGLVIGIFVSAPIKPKKSKKS